MFKQNNEQGSSPTLKPKSKLLLPLALVLTIMAFGSLALAWYKTYYTLPNVLRQPIYTANISTNEPIIPDISNPIDEPNTPNPTDELIDINDYTTIDPNTGWTIYTNETVGYQISYPADWLVDRELGSQGYYDDSVRIKLQRAGNSTTERYYLILVGLYSNNGKNDPITSYFKEYDRVLNLAVGESYTESKGTYTSDKIVKLSKPEVFPETSVLFLRVPAEGSITDFYADTVLYYSQKIGEMFYIGVLVPPSNSEYFADRFNNLVDDGKSYSEALQILESFKPL